jgi:SAM-dependent methyltransferase
MRRRPTEELLDHDLGTPGEIEQSLNDLWRINRWLGGISSSDLLLSRFFKRTGLTRARVLDVGSGDARLAAHLRARFAARDIFIEYFVLDRRLNHLRKGDPLGQGLCPVVADVFTLPFCDESFDVVMCNLFFHHFSGDAARRLLRRLASVACVAVIVNDLERGILPYLFIRLAYPFARSRLTRHDGPASVRQAYTREELCALAEAAGFRNFEIKRFHSFRLGMILWKAGVKTTA